MAEGLNTISVNIYGHRYHVKGTEEKEHLQMVAALVDSKMKEVNLRNPGLNMVQVAILAAMNIADAYIKLRDDEELEDSEDYVVPHTQGEEEDSSEENEIADIEE